MIIPTFYPLVGGSEKQALSISSALIERGIRVKVLTRRVMKTADRETLNGVEVERLKSMGCGVLDSILFLVLSFFYLLKYGREYDIFHVHLASSPAVSALLAGKILGRKVVVKIGGGKGVDEISLSRKSVAGRIKLAFFAVTKPHFLVMNEELLDWLKKSGLKKARFSLFRNGVDTGTYVPVLYHKKEGAKARFGFQKKTVFLFVGRLSPEKRIYEFIEVWSEIISESLYKDKGVLHIVGGGPLEDEIKKSIEALGVSDSVVMAGRQYELKDYYAAADVFILPSVSEGLSNSMLEAMSSGLAVMASKVGGAKLAVQDGENGFLFDPFDRRKIKSIIAKFLETDKLALDMGEKSREVAVRRYSMARVLEELIKIYEQ